MTSTLDYIHNFSYNDLPANVIKQTELCLLDLIGVGIAGSVLPISQVARDHVARFHTGEDIQMLFDGRPVSPMGMALAGATTIDGLDGHDGFNSAKGHVGCGIFPAALAFALEQQNFNGYDFIANIALGYELGSRLAMALHGTTQDYHTSGAWVSLACAAIGSRALGLSQEQTQHALGIAEYHGPRSQMMRVIDHPTMLKDGSGWGAMAGVSASYLAQSGFTGGPAITIEADDVAPYWNDLGERWYILEQYFKPYPVCRWAQAPIEAILELRKTHDLTSQDVEHIEITTFHESIRLATNTPKTSEEAQYSTSYPSAVAMVFGDVRPEHVDPTALDNPEVLRLSQSLKMYEDDYANDAFPLQRYAKVTLVLKDGQRISSDWTSPTWTAEEPPSEDQLRDKFRAYASPIIGSAKTERIEKTVADVADGKSLKPLCELICRPMS